MNLFKTLYKKFIKSYKIEVFHESQYQQNKQENLIIYTLILEQRLNKTLNRH